MDTVGKVERGVGHGGRRGGRQGGRSQAWAGCCAKKGGWVEESESLSEKKAEPSSNRI